MRVVLVVEGASAMEGAQVGARRLVRLLVLCSRLLCRLELDDGNLSRSSYGDAVELCNSQANRGMTMEKCKTCLGVDGARRNWHLRPHHAQAVLFAPIRRGISASAPLGTTALRRTLRRRGTCTFRVRCDGATGPIWHTRAD